ncbi:unnamed protein product [Allacma fusca]|uniref:Elongation of very long chain fatty acids protein n=1 Tax=Allacma fusca TaxID=39272 RepID=A0A8J2K159_9HEXA|nr:unnamed protein product [Allacma fusca]
MSVLVPAYLLNEYNEYFRTKRDVRLDGWLLMGSPWPTLVMCLMYVIIVKYLGPWYMRDRPPYQFKKLLIVYNAVQVLFSLWQFYEFGMGGWFGAYNWRCQPVEKTDTERANRMVRVLWWYYISKLTEFLDTIFFVFRKKSEHVSFLQVFHHGVMPINAWLAARFAPGGHCTLIGFTNTFVHTLMYFYYMMAACGPQYQKFLWWKKYLTHFQMIQFIVVFVHSMQLFFIDCDVPMLFAWLTVFHTAAFLLLFMDYYRKAYDTKKLAHKNHLKKATVNSVPTNKNKHQ